MSARDADDRSRKRHRPPARPATSEPSSSYSSREPAADQPQSKKKSSQKKSSHWQASAPVVKPVKLSGLLTRPELREMRHFSGADDLREIIMMATVASQPIKCSDIRSSDTAAPGLRDYEVNLLELVQKVSNGARVVIDPTGASFTYHPGVITGGAFLQHTCHPGQAIGYYLEVLIVMGLFAKEPVEIDLEGITNDNESMSVDLIRTVTLPFLEKFGLDLADAELKVLRRGAAPLGGGLIHCRLPVVRDKLDSVQLLDPGQIARIRGICYSTRVSPQLANRVITSARAVLHPFTHDVYLSADHFKGAEAGSSPGFGLALVAESTTGMLVATERFAEPGAISIVPEDLGKLAATQLLQEVLQAGCTDANQQWFALLLMALTPRNVSKIVLGPLTPFTIRFLRLLDTFLGVRFKVAVSETPLYRVSLSCVGAGYKNINRRVT